MGLTYTVVDDFYADPDAVRRLGLSHGRWTSPMTDGGHIYSWETRNEFWSEDIADRFAAIIGSRISFDPTSMSFGVFAYYGAESAPQLTTHFDDTDWSSIIYLVRPENCEGGLGLFRHRPTGLTGPPDDHRARELGFQDRQDFLQSAYFPDKLQPDRWEEIERIPMAYNRLVVLRSGSVFHRAASGFGTSPESGRLTQRFFYNEDDSHEKTDRRR